MAQVQRTWTARIKATDWRTGSYTVFEAARSERDLLRDQANAAVLEAAALVDDAQVSVVMYKTTQAHGTRQDRVYTVTRNPRTGRVQYQ